MPHNITFPKLLPQWIFDRDCVQFFAAIDGEHVLKCLVTAEALEAHFGAKELTEDEAVRAFLGHREVIEAAAREKILKETYKSGDEVLLKMADFPRKTNSPLPRPERGLRTVIAPGMSEEPGLLSRVTEANALLERDLARSKLPATATWELFRESPHTSYALLTLTDDETKAAVIELFSPNDLANLNGVRFSPYRIWDNLLQARGKKQLEALEVASTAGVSQ